MEVKNQSKNSKEGSPFRRREITTTQKRVGTQHWEMMILQEVEASMWKERGELAQVMRATCEVDVIL